MLNTDFDNRCVKLKKFMGFYPSLSNKAIIRQKKNYVSYAGIAHQVFLKLDKDFS